jgi:hypothetical protein
MNVAFVSLDDTMEANKAIESPSWEDVEMLIRKMDNDRFSSAGIMLENEDNMLFGGGIDRYVVGSRLDNHGYNLRNKWGDSGKEVRLMNGQISFYPENEIVSLDDALKVARYFFDFNKLHPNYEWDRMV